MRVISRSKNNFYDVIRLKIIESRYFPKEMVKVGLEKSKQNGGQVKVTKCRRISSAEIRNLEVHRDFSRYDADFFIVNAWFQGKNNIGWADNDRILALKQWTGWKRKWVENDVKSHNKY